MKKAYLLIPLAVLVALAGWQLSQDPEAVEPNDKDLATSPTASAKKSQYNASVYRPHTNIGAPTGVAKDTGPKPEVVNYGTTPQTPKKFLESAVGQSVMEAHRDPEAFPERLSPMIMGKKFDAERWKDDQEYRNDYLTVIEPSRAKISSKNPKAPLLQMACRPHQEVKQGEKITLTAKAIPGAPVSFFSPHLNRFENGFTSMTTIANADGLASVVMEGMPGTIARTDVSCASPLCAGLVVFRVTTLQGNKTSE